jgi:hypothetical protein
MQHQRSLTPPRPARQRAGRVVAVLAAAAALVTISAQSASAAPFFPDTGAPNYPVYSGDPHLIQCSDNGQKLCLYASVDDGNGSGANYPMRYTKLWTIDAGANWMNPSNWTYVGVVASEQMISSSDINPRTSHFWAPAALRHNGKNYLFVPDLYNGATNTGSRVYVFDATTPNGPYTYRGRIGTPTSGPDAPNGGYASDPFVARDYNGSIYMFYANGNYDTCGGITRTALSGSNLLTASNTARLTFTGLQADLGTCGNGDPYLEGPAVYSRYGLYDIAGRWPSTFDGIGGHEWIMMFSVKPSKTPTKTTPSSVTCNGSNQQALAYATAPSLTSNTWTYRGIIMCPRGQEWTNHGSLLRNTNHVMLAFHDGPSNNHQRKVMLDCLTWNTNGALRTVPVSQNNAANCNNW